MQLIYNVKDKPKFGQLIVFAIQQLLAIMAATIAVPAIVGNGMTAAAALFGAGAGTIITFTIKPTITVQGENFVKVGPVGSYSVSATLRPVPTEAPEGD